MIKLWANFAKYSNPTPTKCDAVLEGVTWAPVTKDKMAFMEIGDKLQCGTDPDKERMKLWDDIAKIVPAAKDM